MTIGELLEKLSKLPQDMLVATDGGQDNQITGDLYLFRYPATVGRKPYGVYVLEGGAVLGPDEAYEDVVLLAYWGHSEAAVEL